MKVFKRLIILFVSIFIVGFSSEIKAACNNDDSQIIEMIVSAQQEYSDWLGCSLVLYMDLYDNDNVYNSRVYNVLDTAGEKKGYIILSENNRILEYSKNNNPYEVAIIDNSLPKDDVECGYIFGCYEIQYNNMIIWLNSAGEIVSVENNLGVSTYGYVGGTISPQLQNSNNCIVAAISNLIWYYGNNGYPSIISGKTFSVIKANITTIMNSLGGFKNSNIPATLQQYLGSYYSSTTPIWNPSFTIVQNEINAGYPCLLGFAAGSDSYSDIYGHMTVCVGWVRISSSYYTCLMDGHSTNTVTKEWSSSYNDYVCKVRLR